MSLERPVDGLGELAEAVLEHLNTWQGRPAPFRMVLDANRPVAASMQPLAGANRLRSYVDGSYRGQFPFALMLSIDGQDTAAHLDGIRSLYDAAAWLESACQLPIAQGIVADRFVLTSAPSLAARYEDGAETYQAVFRLEYLKTAGL